MRHFIYNNTKLSETKLFVDNLFLCFDHSERLQMRE